MKRPGFLLMLLIGAQIASHPMAAGAESLQSLYRRVFERSISLGLVSEEEAACRNGSDFMKLFLPIISIIPSERHSIVPAGIDYHGSELLYSLEQPLFPGPAIMALRGRMRSEELLLHLRRKETEDRLLMELLVLIGHIETMRFRREYAERLRSEANLIRKASEAAFKLGEITSGTLRSAVLTEKRRSLAANFLEAEEESCRRAWQSLTGDTAVPSFGLRQGGIPELPDDGIYDSVFSRDRQILIIRQGIEERQRRKTFGYESWVPEVKLNLHGAIRTGAEKRNEFGWALVISFRGPGFDLSGSLDYTVSREFRHAQEGLLTLRTGEIGPGREQNGESLLEIRKEELRRETRSAYLELRKAEQEIPLLKEELGLNEEFYRLRSLEFADGLISARDFEQAAGSLSASAEALAEGVYDRYLKQAALLLKAGRRREVISAGLPDPAGGYGKEGESDR